MISITQAKWLKEKCRVKDGIFFSNDEVILLWGHLKEGYDASGQALSVSLLEKYADGWTNVDEKSFLSCGKEWESHRAVLQEKYNWL